MRIAIDGTALYGRFGGVEYALWNLLCALAAREGNTTEYVVYIPHDGPTLEELALFPERWRWERLPFCGQAKLRRILWQQTVLPRLLRAQQCDLLHAPTYVAPLLHRVCRPRVPLVLTVYDTIALDHPEFATTYNRWHYRAVLPTSIARADQVIVPTEAVKTAVVQHVPVAKNKIHVVPLGLEPHFHSAPSVQHEAEVRQRFGLPERYLLYVGNFEPKKNLENVLRAWELVPGAPPLVVAGGARARHDLPNMPHLHVIGYVPLVDLPALYAQCAAFVFPSLAEGFGLPVLEALACGAPVVSSTQVPLPRLSDVALLCDPHSPDSIAAQIQLVLRNEELSARLSQSGREFARDYTWQRAAQQTREIYESARRGQ